MEMTYGSPYGDFPIVTRTEHTYTEEDKGDEVNSSTTVKVTDNQTLYAHWKRNRYNITFDFGTRKVSETFLYEDPINVSEAGLKPFYKIERW